jgi:hypothetical protein
MFSPSSAQAALLAKYGPLPIFIPDFANLQIVQGLNMTERLTPPYGVRISPTFGIALGDTFKHNTTSFSSEITSISCAAAGAVGAFNFQYTDGTYIEANAGTAPTSSAVPLLPEEYINGVSGEYSIIAPQPSLTQYLQATRLAAKSHRCTFRLAAATSPAVLARKGLGLKPKFLTAPVLLASSVPLVRVSLSLCTYLSKVYAQMAARSHPSAYNMRSFRPSEL